MHKLITGIPLPAGAKNLEMERSTLLSFNNCCLISYHLDAPSFAEFLKNPPPGFSNWNPLGEIYIPDHLFTYVQMPHALLSSKKEGKLYSAVLVNPDDDKVYVLSAFN